jgi:hypothetical protein
MPDRQEPTEPRPDGATEGDGSVVSNPGELIRVANMLQVLLFEVHDTTLDEAGRRRLFDVQLRAVEAIKRLVSDDLDLELTNLGLPLDDIGATESELRIAQAQLVGWLNGLFQGIQAAMFARHMVPVDQLQQMQREIAQSSKTDSVGQYL